MQLQPLEVAFLAGLVAAIALAPIAFATRDAIVVISGNRKGIKHVDSFLIQIFEVLAKQGERSETKA
jgi:hypothetical protein